MSAGQRGASGRMEAESFRQLIGSWSESLAQAFESMVGERPEIGCRAGSAPEVSEGGEILWWEQPFPGAAGAAVWVAASRTAWQSAGETILRGAGLEASDPAEIKSAWIETLGQSLAVLARSLGALLGREVVCEGGGERQAAPPNLEFLQANVAFSATVFNIHIGVTPEFLDVAAYEPEAAAEKDTPAVAAAAQSKTLELLMEIDLPISISFGRMQLPMREVLKLTTGSIVELDRDASEPVDVLVNGCLVARGEVVVVEGNYAVRIQHIVSRQDRLRSIR
jgi:flagellar motor switch protein FliN